MVPDYSDSRKVGFTGRLRSAAGVAAVQGAGAKYRWTRLRCAGSAAGCHIQHAVKLAIHALQLTAFIAAMSLRSSHGSARCHRESRCVPPLYSREGTAVCRPRRTPVTSVTGTCARRGSRGGSTVDSAGHAQPRSIRPSSCVRAWLRTRHGRARWSARRSHDPGRCARMRTVPLDALHPTGRLSWSWPLRCRRHQVAIPISVAAFHRATDNQPVRVYFRDNPAAVGNIRRGPARRYPRVGVAVERVRVEHRPPDASCA